MAESAECAGGGDERKEMGGRRLYVSPLNATTIRSAVMASGAGKQLKTFTREEVAKVCTLTSAYRLRA